MGRRRQPRTEIGLRVELWGTYSEGHPFLEVSCTEDLSEGGTHLKGVCAPVKTGDVVGINYGDKKAQFRVIWVGEPGTPYESHIGLMGIVQHGSLWGVNLPAQAPDSYVLLRDGDRRQHARFKCFISVLLRPEGAPLPVWGQVTDISMGGCYVQVSSPLPINTRVKLEFLMKIATLRAEGVICSSHKTRGMGVKFVEMDSHYREQVRQFVKWFAGACLAMDPVTGNSTGPEAAAGPESRRTESQRPGNSSPDPAVKTKSKSATE